MKNYSIPGRTPKVSVDISVRLKFLIAACLVCLSGVQLHAQAIPTASSPGLLQIGGMFNLANSDYVPQKIKGGGFYTTFDFGYHLGIEGEFHQINDSNPATAIYERTYEIGPRYVRRYGRLAPYAKAMYGRGVFNYPPVFGDPNGGAAANLAYNRIAVGAGVDYRALRSVNVRADFEYQQWFGFPPNGLTPTVYSIGAAYRFH
jgi:opacity protein-like surface antigen